MMNTCTICGKNSDAVDFYKGVNCRCKECHKAAIRANRAAKQDYYRAYDKMRFQRDAHRREANKRWAESEFGKERVAAYRRKYVAMNPEKRAAHVILGNAVRSGRVIKPTECSRCGSTPRRRDLHAHHHDYALPLSVEWVCVTCHAVEHFGDRPEPVYENKPRGRHVKD